ncbi:unnamed protein product, partial [marine sediment metagenome]
ILSLILEILGPIYMIYFLVQLVDGFLKIGELDYDINAINEQKKVSVIIPIHNVPILVLEETLVGLTKQTYKNFDVWVGDDSPDENLRKGSDIADLTIVAMRKPTPRDAEIISYNLVPTNDLKLPMSILCVFSSK